MAYLGGALTSLLEVGTNGLLVQTTKDNFNARSIAVSGTSSLTISNAGGISGNPTINLSLVSADITTALTFTPVNPSAAAITGGTINNTTIGATSASSGVFTTVSISSTLSGAGVSTLLASYAPLASPSLTGAPVAPTAPVGTNTTQIATTAFVVGQAATVAPVMDGTATVGISLLYARQDHAHASDTTRAALAGATFTGAVSIPSGTINNTTIGTTTANTGAFTTLSATSTVSGAGFVSLLSPYALLASPTLTGVPLAPTAAVGTNTTQIATTAFVAASTGNAGSIVTTGGSTTLTAAQYGVSILLITGTLTTAATLIVPNSGLWTTCNRTSGAFTVTVKTNAGTGVTVDQGYSVDIIADGTNVLLSTTDFSNTTLQGIPVAPTAIAGTNTTQIATTAFVAATASSNNNNDGRNILRNSHFLVNQRAAPFSYSSPPSGYASDGWIIASSATSVSGNITTGSSAYAYSNYQTVTSAVGASQYVTLSQRIEANSILSLSGQSVTFSFYASASTTAGSFQVSAGIGYASALNNFSTITSISSTNVTVTGTAARYSVTFSSLPTNIANGIVVSIVMTQLTSSGTVTLNVGGCQLEEASSATVLEYRDIAIEQIVSSRYFQTISVSAVDVASAANQQFGATFTYAPMRSTPTVVAGAQGSYSNIANGTMTADSNNSGHFLITSAGSGPCSGVAFQFTLSAEL
jgi:hypothetical protein